MEQQPSGPEQSSKISFNPAELISAPAEVVKEKTVVNTASSSLELGSGEEMDLFEARPEYPQDIPTVIVPGFMETPLQLKEFAVGMAEHGERDTLVVAQPRSGHHESTGEVSADGYEQTYIDRGERLLQTMMKKDYKQVDMVAHSQGCIDAVVAALMAQEANPDLVRSLTLINPAGAIEGDTGAIHGALTAARQGVHELLHDAKSAVKTRKLSNVVGAMRAAAEYVKPDPLRTAAEVVALLQTDIRAGMRILKELGVVVNVVAGVDDRLFPMDKYQKSLTTDEVDGFMSVNGAHNEVLLDAKRHAPAMSALINRSGQLADKRERDSYGLAG